MQIKNVFDKKQHTLSQQYIFMLKIITFNHQHVTSSFFLLNHFLKKFTSSSSITGFENPVGGKKRGTHAL